MADTRGQHIQRDEREDREAEKKTKTHKKNTHRETPSFTHKANLTVKQRKRDREREGL